MLTNMSKVETCNKIYPSEHLRSTEFMERKNQTSVKQ